MNIYAFVQLRQLQHWNDVMVPLEIKRESNQGKTSPDKNSLTGSLIHNR